ncbi:unnamed protein product [Zymoseptoria tritici ST99CH_1A5]|uniref:BTB domain-containing protein n=1 Tax=Zymoseptoria tritici ST99CH_1A5 TaxID=1276529 RepID=A0A1Y6LVX9_ZYMTR|nr:unnamed protein product [Zymoseptoria tritici ST99CH_1A5]
MASNSVISTSISLPYFPDVVFECGSQLARKQVHCHKAVICPRSSFLKNQYAHAGGDPSAAGDKTKIIIDSLYDGKAVETVLKSLYRPSSDMEWLQGLGWIELLRVFQVVYLFQLPNMQPTILSTATQKLDQINTRNEINSAIDGYRNLTQPSFMWGHFHADADKLRNKLSALIAQQWATRLDQDTAMRRKLIDTMAMLGNPATRSEVSEEAYGDFLKAVRSSNWLHQGRA